MRMNKLYNHTEQELEDFMLNRKIDHTIRISREVSYLLKQLKLPEDTYDTVIATLLLNSVNFDLRWKAGMIKLPSPRRPTC